jgi:hypothetical protein
VPTSDSAYSSLLESSLPMDSREEPGLIVSVLRSRVPAENGKKTQE